MTHSFFGITVTVNLLASVAWISFAFLVLFALALIGDKRAWREPPHYLLPCRGSVYFAMLILSAVVMISAVLLKLKYFP